METRLANDNALVLGKHFHLSPTALTVTGEPTFQEWSAACEQLQVIHQSVHWWLGDLLRYGEAKWGEKYTQAVEETPFTHGTLRNDVWVATAIDQSRRNDRLTFSHHAVVAALPPAEQDEWLDRAEREGWSSRQLWAESRDATPPVILYDGMGRWGGGPHRWIVRLPDGEQPSGATAGAAVHIIIREKP